MSSVFFPQTLPSRTPKLHVSAGNLPAYINPKQPPTKKSPWRQINEAPFVKTLTLTLPSMLHDQIWSKIQNEPKNETSIAAAVNKDQHKTRQLAKPIYAKILTKLEDILTGDFFNTYIKIGNILMISEGIPGINNTTATLQNGILRLELSKEVYLRCGIQGQPIKNHGGRKHVKERYVIELNLRLPSMVRGKKGFDRLLYAARNVLNETKIWLFCNLMPELSAENSVQDPILAKYHPTIVADGPSLTEVENVIIPKLISRSSSSLRSNTILPVQDHETYYEIVEWLDLVNLGSSRVTTDDDPDPYICRYALPSDPAESTSDDDDEESGIRTTETVRILRWNGLLSSSWVTQLLIELVKHARSVKSDQWLAVSVTSHRIVALGGVDGYTVLLRPSPEESREDDAYGDQMEIDSSTQATNDSDSATKTSLRDAHCFQFVDTLKG